jgi:hypothetical protein
VVPLENWWVSIPSGTTKHFNQSDQAALVGRSMPNVSIPSGSIKHLNRGENPPRFRAEQYAFEFLLVRQIINPTITGAWGEFQFLLVRLSKSNWGLTFKSGGQRFQFLLVRLSASSLTSVPNERDAGLEVSIPSGATKQIDRCSRFDACGSPPRFNSFRCD